MGRAEIFVFGEGAKRLREGALLLFNKWVRGVRGEPKPGDLVSVYDGGGGFLGCGLYETVGPVAVRLLSHREFHGSRFDLFIELFEKALRRRKIIGYLDTGFYRLINSDGDFIPGLIVDVYNDIVVIQSSSQAIDEALKDIVEALVEIYGEDITVYEKSDQKSRSDIGLMFRRRFLKGSKEETVIHEGNSKFIVNIVYGQKTGFFLDQRENRLFLEKLVEPGAKVLDLFSYTGGFGIHASNAGAGEVFFVESDKKAVEVLRRNLKLNSISKYKVYSADVWDVLPKIVGEKFDIIIADPPAFIPSKEHYSRGSKAYFRLFSYVAKMAKEGSVVFLSSCSYFLETSDFLKLANRAFRSQNMDHILLGTVRGAAADHVFNIESQYLDYLKSIFLEVI